MKNFKLHLFVQFLFISLPFALITGPFLPDFFATLSGAIYLYLFFLKKIETKFFFNPFVFLFFIFYLYILIRSIFVPQPLISFEVSLFYFRNLFFALSLAYFFLNYEKLIKYLYYSILLSLVIVTFDGYIQFFFGKNIFGWSPIQSNRLGGLFGKELILGSFISMIFPILIALRFYLFKKNNYFTFYLSIFIAPLVFFSGERTALGLFIIYLLFLLIVLPFDKRILLAYLMLFLVIFIILISHDSPIKQKMFNETINEIGETKFKIILHSPAHSPMYESSIRMFKDSPFFGQGPGMFEAACHQEKFYIENSCNTHPHNHYIQSLAEIGILGFFFIFSLFLYLSIKIFYLIFLRYRNNSSDYISHILFLLPLYLNLIPFFPNRDFYNNWDNVFYYIGFGMLIYSIYIFQNKINYVK